MFENFESFKILEKLEIRLFIYFILYDLRL